MARIETDPNYTTPTFPRATASSDPFKKEDVQKLAEAISGHTHAAGKGLAVAGIANGTVTSAMIADGTVTGTDIANATITGANIAGFTITGSNIVNDTIGAQQIAPGAVGAAELAADLISQSLIVSGLSSNPTTSSAAMVDCPDMAITFTARGGDVLVWFAITLQHTNLGNLGAIQIALDGTDSTVVMAGSCPTANGLFMLFNMLRIPTLAGAHTFKGRWANLSGSGVLTANSNARLLMVQETRR